MAKKAPEEEATADNVDQIREIIFGAHIKDYEQRFRGVERKLEQSLKKVSDAFNKRLDELDKSLTELKQMLEAEQAERRDGDESLDALLQNQAREAGEQLASVESQTNEQLDALNQSLNEMTASLESQLGDQGAAQGKALEDLNSQLTAQNISRKELAKLLGTVASTLDAPPKAPRKRRR
ncbi:MAG: hypothetical protein AAF358_25225 [Pseudomonadota bacterium]